MSTISIETVNSTAKALRKELILVGNDERITAMKAEIGMQLDELQLVVEARKHLDAGGKATDYPDGYAVGSRFWSSIFDQATSTQWEVENGQLTVLAVWIQQLMLLADNLGNPQVDPTATPTRGDTDLQDWERELLGL